MSYKSDRYIDLNKLEWECARMSDLFKYWGDQWAEACKQRDLLAEKVKLTRSRILEDVRVNWKQHNFEKPPTDKQAEAFYRTRAEYIDVKKAWVEAEATSRKLYIAWKSMEIKDNNLSREQRLYAGEYWSTPYSDPGYTAMRDEEIKAEMSQELNKEDKSRLGKRLVRRKND